MHNKKNGSGGGLNVGEITPSNTLDTHIFMHNTPLVNELSEGEHIQTTNKFEVLEVDLGLNRNGEEQVEDADCEQLEEESEKDLVAQAKEVKKYKDRVHVTRQTK